MNKENEQTDHLPSRAEIPLSSTWDLERMFPHADAWEDTFLTIEEAVVPMEALRGQLHDPQALLRYYQLDEVLSRCLEKLYTYAHLRADEDTANTENQSRLSRIRTRYTQVGTRLSWMEPELLKQDAALLESWAKSELLASYAYPLRQLIRKKAHTLGTPEETILARAGDVFGSAQQTYGLLTNADMTFPEVEDAEGHRRALSQGRFVTFLMDRNRDVRRRAFGAMYDTYAGVKNSLTSTLAGTVKLHNFMAQTRHFDSALAASLHDDDIPVSLYESLIEAVHGGLPVYFRYLDLRRKMLKLEALDMYDMYVPLVPAYDMHVDFETACQWVLEACAPLGPEYTALLERAFQERWMDVPENRGKRSGAYSSGCYDSNPYVLLNYQGTLDHVFTLAHELGHSLHSWLADERQPYHLAQYPIFTAEIASTLNEELLLHYLLEKNAEPRFRAYLLNHACDSFKGTVYRQTMFAEFEKMIHEKDAEGEAFTPDSLGGWYEELITLYFGSAVKPDPRIRYEWSRIPHFYYNFYVYKYATSFCASQIFVDQVRSGAAGRDAYLDLLRGGGSDAPLKLIARAGVDLNRPETLLQVFNSFSSRLDELETLLAQLQ